MVTMHQSGWQRDGGGSDVPRDTVPPLQEKQLALRSGNVCAYPGCGVPLILQAEHLSDRDKIVGKVAHICAASEGGPRYDPSMTKEERGSVSNLVLLCGSHHDIIDTQLNYHTVDFLAEMKQCHERKVARALAHAMGEVGFDHLEIVCKAIQLNDKTSDDIVMPLDIETKISLNNLGEATREQIRLGMAKVAEVTRFIVMMDDYKDNFGARLAARFKQEYWRGVADGLEGDELYSTIQYVALQNAGPVESAELRAAVLAVVTYLFTKCEIFEHESTAA